MTNYFRKYRSLYSTTLSSSIGTGTGETITFADVTNVPTDTEVTITIDRVDSSGTATASKMERITGTLSGSNLTSYTRGADNSTEQAHSAGAVVEMVWNSSDWNAAINGLLVEHNQTGTHKPTAWVTASDGATVTFNLTSGTKQKVTLGGNRTLALSNVVTGHVFVLKLIQDATGSRTVTWFSGISWADDTVPTLTTTASNWDVFGFIQTGTNTYDGFIIGQGLN